MLDIRLQATERTPRAREIRFTGHLSVVDERSARRTLPAIPRELSTLYLQRLNSLIEDLSSANSNPHWWYLPVSERQPFMSRVFSALEIEAHMAAIAEEDREGADCYLLTVRDGLVARYLLRALAAHSQARVHADWRDRGRWWLDRAMEWPRRWSNALLWVVAQVRVLCATRAADGVSPLPARVDTLFVSRFEADLERSSGLNGPWRDRYLGDLPNEGWQRTGSVVLVGRCGGRAGRVAKAVSVFADFPVRTIYQFLAVRDLPKILVGALAVNLRYAGGDLLGELAVSESRNHVRAVAECILVETAMLRLLSGCRPRQIVCMQENSVWEHAVVLAARAAAPEARLVGYFHCPVMPAGLRYHATRLELQRRPVFPNVIPLGPAMADALKCLGEWGERLGPGYGFRHPDIDQCLAIPVVRRTSHRFVLVVLLGGSFDDGTFLRWVESARRGLPAHRLIIKGHPVFGASRALQAAGIEPCLLEDVEEAASPSMAEVLRGAHCVVYKGTTAGLSALAAGVPAVHVDHGGLLSDDTLFDSGNLVSSVSTPAEFRAAVELAAMRPQEEHATWSARAREYARRYYARTPESREQVLRWLFEPRCDRIEWN